MFKQLITNAICNTRSQWMARGSESLGYNLLRRNLTGSWITPDEENKIEVKSVKLVKSENDMILQIGRWE